MGLVDAGPVCASLAPRSALNAASRSESRSAALASLAVFPHRSYPMQCSNAPWHWQELYPTDWRAPGPRRDPEP